MRSAKPSISCKNEFSAVGVFRRESLRTPELDARRVPPFAAADRTLIRARRADGTGELATASSAMKHRRGLRLDDLDDRTR